MATSTRNDPLDPGYAALPTALLRCAVAPAGDHVPPVTAASSPAGELARLWDDAVLREAVRVASPTLAAGVEDTLRSAAAVAGVADAGPVPADGKQVRALVRSLTKYRIRTTSRPTPFGVCAGTALVPLGDRPLALGTAHHKHVRLGAGAVRRLRQRAEIDDESLRVQLNPTARVVGSRLVLVGDPRGGASATNDSVSVAHTDAVRLVCSTARTPTTRTALLDALEDTYREAARDVLSGFLRQLVERGVLLTELAPSVFDLAPADRLQRSTCAEEAARLTQALDAYASTPLGDGEEALQEVYELLRSDAPHDVQEQVQVDLRLDARGEVDPDLARRLVEVVEVLTRTSLLPAASPALAAHAQQFVDTFGQCVVPLPVVFAELGAPPGYPTARPGGGQPVEPEHAREAQLAQARLRAALLHRALRTGRTSVELTTDDLKGLPQPVGRRVPSYDVFAVLTRRGERVEAALGPTGVSFPAGKAAGRFAHLDERVREHVVQAAQHERLAEPNALLCQIDYVYNRAAINNVAATPAVHEGRLLVTSGPPGDSADRDGGRGAQVDLLLDDVLVGVVEGRFYFQYARDGRRLLFRSAHLVTPEAAVDVVRFLEEVSHDGYVKPCWTWGSLGDCVDATPGVTFGGVTLVAPRWRLPALEGTSATAERRLTAWLLDRDVPRFVHVGRLDNRLLLDLEEPVHRTLLLREAAAGVEWVEAAPEPDAAGVVPDPTGARFATEVVVSAAATRHRAHPPLPRLPRYDPGVSPAERLLPPGRQWWYLRLEGDREHQDEVLTRMQHERWCPAGSWWFVRYSDPAHHLRLRVDAGAVDVTGLCERLAVCQDEGLLASVRVDSYRREVERYGGLQGLLQAERLWCAETEVLAGHLALLPELPDTPGGSSTSDAGGGLRRAAAWVEGYIDGLGLDAALHDRLLEASVAGYREEFADTDHELRREARPAHAPEHDLGLEQAVQELVASVRGPASRVLAAVDRTDEEAVLDVLQSCVHMFANRLGLHRHREYQVLHLLRARSRARLHSPRKASA